MRTSLATTPAARLPASLPARLRSLAGAFASFEFLFALFLYSNSFKVFIVDLLPSGLEETTLLLALSFLAGAWVMLRRGVLLAGLAATAAGLLFFAWVAFSWTWSPSRTLARRELLMLFTGGFWSLAGATLVVAAERERVLRLLAFTVAIGVPCTVGGWIYYFDYGNFLHTGMWRELGFRAIYQQLAVIAALSGLLALLAATAAPVRPLPRAAALAVALSTLSFLLVAGSRQSLVGALAGLVLLLAFLPVRVGRGTLRLSRGHLLLLAVLVCGTAVAVYLLAAGADLYTILRLFSALDKVDSPVLFMYDRPFYFASALRLWFSAPFTGIGLMGLAPAVFGHELPGTHPHDVVLQILAETGLVGLALFALFLWACLRRVDPARLRGDRLLLAVLVGGTVPWAVALFSATIGTAWLLYAFLGLLTLPPPERGNGPAQAAPREPAVRPPRVLH